MSEKVESGVVSGESDVQVEREQISTEERDEQSSQSELDEHLMEQIRNEVERRFQSAKDRRWAQLEKQYGSLNELSERLGTMLSGGQVSEGDGQEGRVMSRAVQLLERTGLANDPEVIALLREKNHSQDMEGYLDLLEDLTRLVLVRAGKGKASAATVMQPSGGVAPAQDLRQAYEQRKKQLRPGDVNALMALKREFRDKGLDVF